eukprot:Nk52_evm15s2171 gene=Nk52_evmTU15s2171
MAAYQAADSKKEEFRKYLEKSGTIDALTKVLVGLYEEPEKPSNALDFLKQYLGAPAGVDVEELRKQNEAYKIKLQEMETENQELRAKIAEYSQAADATGVSEDK